METLAPVKKQNIFEITQEALALNEILIENGGELTEDLEKAMELNRENFETKAINYSLVIKQNDLEADIIDAEIKRLQGLKKSRDNASKRLKEVLKGCMNLYGIDKIKTPTRTLYLKSSESIEITDENLVPNDFKEWKPEVKKTLIKDAIKQGEQVPGAELKSSQSLIIK